MAPRRLGLSGGLSGGLSHGLSGGLSLGLLLALSAACSAASAADPGKYNYVRGNRSNMCIRPPHRLGSARLGSDRLPSEKWRKLRCRFNVD